MDGNVMAEPRPTPLPREKVHIFISSTFNDMHAERDYLVKRVFPHLLEAIGKRGPTVIVIDALNQLDSGLTDVGWLPRQLPDNIKLIVSFKRGDDPPEKLYERFSESNQVRLSEVKPFADLDDRRRLVREYLSQYLKELDEQHLETLLNLRGAEDLISDN